jgi:hypothetical protein
MKTCPDCNCDGVIGGGEAPDPARRLSERLRHDQKAKSGAWVCPRERDSCSMV